MSLRTGKTFTEQLGQGLADIINPLAPAISMTLRPYQQLGEASEEVAQQSQYLVWAAWAGVALLGVYILSKMVK